MMPHAGDPRFSDLCRGLPVETEEMDPMHATEADLLPAERAQVSNAVTKRVREFAAGRQCARKAMSRLGVSMGPLLNDLHCNS
jgi:4'-phosphopantetheinyl transferase EntD